jgi:hypothetical protein
VLFIHLRDRRLLLLDGVGLDLHERGRQHLRPVVPVIAER